MNKDEMKMIEEMARVLCNKRCGECEYIPRLCGYKSYCTRLYNAGCRIVGEDEQVVNSKQFFETLNAAQESGKRIGYAQGREETAREILQEMLKEVESMEVRANLQRKTVKVEELKSYCDWIIHKVVPKTIKDFANKYSIELE